MEIEEYHIIDMVCCTMGTPSKAIGTLESEFYKNNGIEPKDGDIIFIASTFSKFGYIKTIFDSYIYDHNIKRDLGFMFFSKNEAIKRTKEMIKFRTKTGKITPLEYSEKDIDFLNKIQKHA